MLGLMVICYYLLNVISSCLNGSQNSAGPTTKAADTAGTSAAAGSSASGSASHAGNTAASSAGAITYALILHQFLHSSYFV